MNETMVTVVGNIASELTVRRVGPDEHLLVGFRVASSERRWDRSSASWVDGDRFSAWVTCWRRLGEHVRGSLVKGDPVVVRGRLSVREYEANGERRYSTDISAIAVGPDLTRCTAQVTRQKLSALEPERTDPAAAADTGSGPTAAPDLATAPDRGAGAPAEAVTPDRGATPDPDEALSAGRGPDVETEPAADGSPSTRRARKDRPVTAAADGLEHGAAEQGEDRPRPLPATA